MLEPLPEADKTSAWLPEVVMEPPATCTWPPALATTPRLWLPLVVICTSFRVNWLPAPVAWAPVAKSEPPVLMVTPLSSALPPASTCTPTTALLGLSAVARIS